MALTADITITIGSDDIGLLRTASLDLTLELVQAAAEDLYGWDDFLPGLRSWQASGQVFVPFRGAGDAYEALMTAFHDRAAVTAAMAINGATETGSALLSAVNLSATTDGLLEGSLTLEGAGVLTAS